MSRRPIGIFDSGEGGLTVMREIARLCPGEDLLYACDTARFPYGPRPREEVRRFFLCFVRFFAEQGCKLVVVACNTATAATLDLLGEGKLPVPAVGVVEPGARAAAAASATGRIGVVATEGTCASGVYPELIRKFRPDAVVVQQPCPILVTRAEEGVISGPAVRAEVERCLEPLLAAGIDTLVLGCTHFPHMRAVIADVAGPNVTLVDPGVATAQEVAARLAAAGQVADGGQGKRTFFTTGDPARFSAVASRLWPGGVTQAQRIQLDPPPAEPG
ncbi:MAG TPA: glutamate racemase [Symbiobacteriaceae bacterium]